MIHGMENSCWESNFTFTGMLFSVRYKNDSWWGLELWCFGADLGLFYDIIWLYINYMDLIFEWSNQITKKKKVYKKIQSIKYSLLIETLR